VTQEAFVWLKMHTILILAGDGSKQMMGDQAPWFK